MYGATFGGVNLSQSPAWAQNPEYESAKTTVTAVKDVAVTATNAIGEFFGKIWNFAKTTIGIVLVLGVAILGFWIYGKFKK